MKFSPNRIKVLQISFLQVRDHFEIIFIRLITCLLIVSQQLQKYRKIEKSNKTYSKKAKWIEIKIEHVSNYVVKENEEREKNEKQRKMFFLLHFNNFSFLYSISHIYLPLNLVDYFLTVTKRKAVSIFDKLQRRQHTTRQWQTMKLQLVIFSLAFIRKNKRITWLVYADMIAGFGVLTGNTITSLLDFRK